ncbi:DUF4304 domain-containing protein [Dactylosporangium siamense]|uniref:DUF4304 domain-containing protein n=1 Tax=Dactylosporangium siamense TaxID=685454 RepID=A0A919Q010_9ACTN|nr:DUF4304 domain-containing protein [Dactylosporangium siamense]GIG51425.1 hypothetical protein Dsi01nite_094660 [Dactylosporangium siamense]
MISPPDETKPAMDRSAKAVISELLARDVTPVLRRQGFAGRGRNYRRTLPDRQELLTVEPHRWNSRHGGAFTIHLGVFLHDLDAFVALVPPSEPPDEHQCHLRRPGSHWWTFDAATDLRSLGADAGRAVQDLSWFDELRTDAGVLAWVRGTPLPYGVLGLRHVYLAATAGAPDLAQEWLSGIVADAPPGPLPREAARFAARLGLDCPPPVDAPALTAMFRTAPDQDGVSAVRHLVDKLEQHLRELRLEHPAAYHTLARDGHTCTAGFYGATTEEFLRPLLRAFAKLAPSFADVTWR